jgi:hypothetical protein
MMGSVASALIAISLFGHAQQADPSSSAWESDYGRALTTTRQAQQKPLLVVIDMPTDAQHRIEPVRLIKEQSVNQDAGLLAAYELCHVDASTEYGKKVARSFKTTTFPHVAVIDKTGRKIIHTATGPLTDAQWKALLINYKAGQVPQAAPVSFFEPSFSAGSYCPSCQRGWR